eukprot:scaffold117718_cov75-Phaeocystis_antarctica.AAC.1
MHPPGASRRRGRSRAPSRAATRLDAIEYGLLWCTRTVPPVHITGALLSALCTTLWGAKHLVRRPPLASPPPPPPRNRRRCTARAVRAAAPRRHRPS